MVRNWLRNVSRLVASRRRPNVPGRGRTYKPYAELLEDRRLLATFIVNTTAAAGPGSLEQAILNANSPLNPGPDLITFNIPGAGVRTIQPFLAFSPITETSQGTWRQPKMPWPKFRISVSTMVRQVSCAAKSVFGRNTWPTASFASEGVKPVERI